MRAGLRETGHAPAMTGQCSAGRVASPGASHFDPTNRVGDA